MHRKILLTLILVVATVSGGVAAQQGTDAPNGTDIPSAPEAASDLVDDQTEYECIEHIDSHVSICEVSTVDGQVELILESDRRQRVTITEAMFSSDGELARESVLLAEGVNRVRFPLDTSGDVAVTIDTGTVLYGKVIESSDTLVGGPWGVSDAQAAGAGAGVGVASITLLLVLKRVYGRDDHAERVA